MCTALVIYCELMRLIVCSLIWTLTQKGILRAAKCTTSSESTATSAAEPLTNTHLMKKKKVLPWLLTASLLSISPTPPLSLCLHLSLTLRGNGCSKMRSCGLTGIASQSHGCTGSCEVDFTVQQKQGCFYRLEYSRECSAFVRVCVLSPL